MSSVDRKLHWIWGLIVVAVLIALGALGLSALHASRRMHVEDVRVRGHHRLTADEVAAAAGLDGDVDWLTIRPSRIEARLANHPWIRRARVHRSFPRHLVIDVEERRPVAWVLDGRPCLVDVDGTPFRPEDAVETVDLPVITGIDTGTGLPGDAELVRRTLAEAVAMIGEIQALPEAPSFDELHLGPEGRWSIVVSSGREIVLGTREQTLASWDRYRFLAPRLARDPGFRALRIDVSPEREAYVIGTSPQARPASNASRLGGEAPQKPRFLRGGGLEQPPEKTSAGCGDSCRDGKT